MCGIEIYVTQGDPVLSDYRDIMYLHSVSTLVTSKTGSQLRRSTPDHNNGQVGRTKPMVSADYIVGLTDGEGCFYIQIRKSKRYRVGATVHLHFHIKLKEVDKNLLEKVKNTLNCGNVYFQNDTRSNHTNCYRYSVSSHQDIIGVVIPFFRENRLQSSSKKKSFEIFYKIAQLITEKKHLTKDGIKTIEILKKNMNI